VCVCVFVVSMYVPPRTRAGHALIAVALSEPPLVHVPVDEFLQRRRHLSANVCPHTEGGAGSRISGRAIGERLPSGFDCTRATEPLACPRCRRAYSGPPPRETSCAERVMETRGARSSAWPSRERAAPTSFFKVTRGNSMWDVTTDSKMGDRRGLCEDHTHSIWPSFLLSTLVLCTLCALVASAPAEEDGMCFGRGEVTWQQLAQAPDAPRPGPRFLPQFPQMFGHMFGHMFHGRA
jgi:hypothetical protein